MNTSNLLASLQQLNAEQLRRLLVEHLIIEGDNVDSLRLLNVTHRDLLTSDGVILVSINDENRSRLRRQAGSGRAGRQ